MKLNTILSAFVFVAGVHASSQGTPHNIARGQVHKARSPKFVSEPDTAVLSGRAVSPADCDKGALINKLLLTVPTSLVSSMLAEPTPFHNDNPPEFWVKLDDHEKECMAALWPADAKQVSTQATEVVSAQGSTTEPCTDTTITSTITQTLTVTLPATPSSATTTVPIVSQTSSVWPTSKIPSEVSKTAPYGNGTVAHSPAPSAAGAPNSTSPSLPEFTGGQGMLTVSFLSTAMAAVVAIAFCLFA
jgi:hypothetical protein